MDEDRKGALGRRQFFRALGGGSVAVAAAAVGQPMMATPAQAYDPGTEETKARYRESDEVKAFYRTNGYETLKK
ncbi:formate dehydrogenase [Methylobacterium sp. Leaf399]|uniref:hypothetical protein n=1 Tax=unclassified Methylobacterium TaxID=2615210 RepID=UPI0006F9315D|nr:MULTISPECIES: hypothetical protein [unclassified Methylobacterium]KQP51937.1 formate dehydrogenase [Methylobacterium sp. Leaf108]KQT14641.1 formate dehydrogenase [Methylobacterium sp. Leaf399]KQT90305.1 formate dehydrogenase [Methylobacterium sp. Leaf466]